MRTAFVFLFSLSIISSSSQDTHYSQFYNSLQFVNPTLFSIQKTDYSLQIHRRSQWYSVTKPFNTTSFTFGGKNIYKDFSLGFTTLNDITGDSRFSTNAALISISNTLFFNEGIILYAIQPSFYQQSIDYNDLIFIQNEPINLRSQSFFDLSFALSYYKLFKKESSFIFGVSLFHVNKPNQSFSQNNNVLLPVKTVYYSSFSKKTNSQNTLSPVVFFSTQNTTREFVAGCSFSHIINDEIEITSSMLNRYRDAIILAIGLKNKNIKFEASYDINTSTLRNASSTIGALEFSLVYEWNKKIKNNNDKEIICPKYL